MILRFAGMIFSPVSTLTTSSGIFSPSRMLLSASVRLSWSVWRFSLNSSSICLSCCRFSRELSLARLVVFRDETLTSMTIPYVPLGTRSEVSRTSAAFSPKIARSRRSSGASSVSVFGVILPTRMSPGLTSAPTRITPSCLRFLSASSLTFGMSRVISSGPSFVSRAPHSNSSMWMDVYTSSFTRRSLITIASSKL